MLEALKKVLKGGDEATVEATAQEEKVEMVAQQPLQEQLSDLS